MENSIYLALSRQSVLKTNMDIVANNIANMNTTGFRAQSPLFEEYISDPAYNKDPMSFVLDYAQFQNTAPGSHEQTGSPFHVALSGPGFLAVEAKNGETVYTRDGNFMRSADGMLVTASGLKVGGGITIPTGSSEVRIDEKGVVSNQNGPIGQLQIVEFDNVQSLRALGNNTYRTDGGVRQAENTTVQQGFLEGSNVNAVSETNRMIEILRDYQRVQRLLDGEHERLRGAIQKLTKV